MTANKNVLWIKLKNILTINLEKYNTQILKDKPLINKRTSTLTSFVKRMKKEFNRFYIQDLPEIKNFINSL